VNSVSHDERAPAAGLRLEQTRAAFDSVAHDYDGERGNNASVQDMRAELWRWLDALFPQPSRLIDLGCGTGLDAVRLAAREHAVTATDWSPRMIERTRARAAAAGLEPRIAALALGAHELERLPGAGCYDGAYSDLGALNCVPELAAVARECARLLRPGGTLVFSVIGRVCPWELAHYLPRARLRRAAVRFARGAVAVGMNRRTIWTRYYTPREFYRPFRGEFTLQHYRGLCLCVPPPYLAGLRLHHRQWYERLWRLDRRVAGWPLLRACGDHFLIVMRRRAAGPA
jgi:SAM-dependent methyltransferase